MEEIKVFAFMMETPFYRKYGDSMRDHDMHCGHYNGYVGFKEDLPETWVGSEGIKSDVLDKMIDIHGGITCDSVLLPTATLIPVTEVPEDYLSYRIIGFDTEHRFDTEEKWTFEATKNETLSLYKQIKEIIKNNKL